MSLWKRNGEPYLLVSQPYELWYEKLTQIVEFCEQHELRCDLEARPSWYFPGSTFAVVFRRRS